jgi:hypothetical protein
VITADATETWVAITAVATGLLVLGVPIALITFAQAHRSDRESARALEARRWDRDRRLACSHFITAHYAVMVAAGDAHNQGRTLGWPDVRLSEFEAALFELFLIAPNKLVASAQELWAMTRTFASLDSPGQDMRARCEEARDRFVEQARAEFNLPVLFEKSIESKPPKA